MTSFAFALINDSLLRKVTVYSKSTYTNMKAEWLSATDSTHTSTIVQKCTICLFWFVHQLKPSRGGGLHLPHSHRAILFFCFLSAHSNANLSIYPALPASPLRSLCVTASASGPPPLLFFFMYIIPCKPQCRWSFMAVKCWKPLTWWSQEAWSSTHLVSVHIIRAVLLSSFSSVRLSLQPPHGILHVQVCVCVWQHDCTSSWRCNTCMERCHFTCSHRITGPNIELKDVLMSGFVLVKISIHRVFSSSLTRGQKYQRQKLDTTTFNPSPDTEKHTQIEIFMKIMLLTAALHLRN